MAAAAALLVLAGACASGGDDHAGRKATKRPATCKPVGDISTATGAVNVAVSEWFVKPDAGSVPGGTVAFTVRNDGDENHEFVIVNGVAPNSLPRKKDGSLDEDALPPGALAGEVEEFAPGTTCAGVFALTPGDYTLLCNVVEKEEATSTSRKAW